MPRQFCRISTGFYSRWNPSFSQALPYHFSLSTQFATPSDYSKLYTCCLTHSCLFWPAKARNGTNWRTRRPLLSLKERHLLYFHIACLPVTYSTSTTSGRSHQLYVLGMREVWVYVWWLLWVSFTTRVLVVWTYHLLPEVYDPLLENSLSCRLCAPR